MFRARFLANRPAGGGMLGSMYAPRDNAARPFVRSVPHITETNTSSRGSAAIKRAVKRSFANAGLDDSDDNDETFAMMNMSKRNKMIGRY